MRLRTVEFACSAVLSAGLLHAADPGEGAHLFRSVCATCHGPTGQGKRELFAPSIGGLPAWYVRVQLEKFRTGHRGQPPDLAGTAMRSIAVALAPEVIPQIAAHVASLDGHPTEGPEPENLSRAADYFFETCAPCHRYNGHGERAFQSAPITLLSGWYVEASLRKFRDRLRGNHPEDEHGAKMQTVTAHLSDAMIAELARYLAVLAKRHPPGNTASPFGGSGVSP